MSGPSAEERIRRTLAAYCHTVDDGRFDDFAQLFTKDGQLQVGTDDPVVGRGAITAFIERFQPPERRGKHLLGEPWIELTPDHTNASAITDFAWVGRTGDGGWAITTVGRYDDHLVRDHGPTHGGDSWLFARRTITLLDP
ncbi:MAG TPA: nuclear transport factor 2 family protein [Acidimicrobiales bacterium]|jgi:hypothetical protein|nr:nuclear transport factor 2 family protein [Acidimicrobiales bacterium]